MRFGLAIGYWGLGIEPGQQLELVQELLNGHADSGVVRRQRHGRKLREARQRGFDARVFGIIGTQLDGNPDYLGPALTFALLDFLLPLVLAVEVGRKRRTVPRPAEAHS